MHGVGVDRDDSDLLIAFSNDKQMSDEESKNSSTNSGAGAQMDMDMEYVHHSDESGDEFKERSHQPTQGTNSGSVSCGSAVRDKFDDFTDAYNAESPPNWHEDNHLHGPSSDEDESDRSKDDDSDGAQSTPQQAPQCFQQHVHARQQDAPRRKVAQHSRSVLSHQDIPPQWAAPSSHIA
ncbi:hypothetical protein HD554DRAFT_2037469 [Boletus coccyginus]|nr:hypothetical protein HD554DRAFT_2037469 [Boletus coccyginus]